MKEPEFYLWINDKGKIMRSEKVPVSGYFGGKEISEKEAYKYLKRVLEE